LTDLGKKFYREKSVTGVEPRAGRHDVASFQSVDSNTLLQSALHVVLLKQRFQYNNSTYLRPACFTMYDCIVLGVAPKGNRCKTSSHGGLLEGDTSRTLTVHVRFLIKVRVTGAPEHNLDCIRS